VPAGLAAGRGSQLAHGGGPAFGAVVEIDDRLLGWLAGHPGGHDLGDDGVSNRLPTYEQTAFMRANKSVFDLFIFYLDAATEEEQRADWMVFADWAQREEPDMRWNSGHRLADFMPPAIGPYVTMKTNDRGSVWYMSGKQQDNFSSLKSRPIIPISVIADQLRVPEPAQIKVLNWAVQWSRDGETCRVGCAEVALEDMERIQAMAKMGVDTPDAIGIVDKIAPNALSITVGGVRIRTHWSSP